jgi:hypothetical protein
METLTKLFSYKLQQQTPELMGKGWEGKGHLDSATEL